MKGFLPRLHVLRSLAPRVSAPLLPITNIRLARSALTNTPRVPHIRLFTRSSARLTSRSPSPTTNPQNALPPDASMSQRLKHLIKTYGWYALGVYLVIGALDFGVAFVGINLLGAQYVSQVVASVKTMVGSVLHSKPAEPGKDEMESINNPHANGGQEGLYAMLVLAYTIHKTLFLPVRVGVTAAVTPRLVGWLTRRGWSGTSGARRAGQEVRERIRERQNRGSR